MKPEKLAFLLGGNAGKLFAITVDGNDLFSIHESIAMELSGYFRAILKHNGESDTSFQESKTRHVHLNDFEPETITKMMLFMYTGHTGYNYKDNANFLPMFKLYVLADYLQIPLLKKHIIDKYFWGAVRYRTLPTIQSTEFLFTKLCHAPELRSLVICHWRDSQSVVHARFKTLLARDLFQSVLREHVFKRADADFLKCRITLYKNRPSTFYSPDVAEIWTQRTKEKTEMKRQRPSGTKYNWRVHLKRNKQRV